MPKSIHRPEYKVLLEFIRETRVARGVTQDVLSDRLGRGQASVSDIERGVRRIDVLELRDLCQQIGADFLGFVAELEKRLVSIEAEPSKPAAKRKPRAPHSGR
ncbi:helix-turn-helix domain-containing protein [Dyella mobilis]|uniref:Helix-turn-helix transcriptional regulator n=1 Tax=Dyella mobilis TaxID=1849582 RepID=A0ABS2KA37_9GAMM|nr:helix-turn-helix transcriptional regulator [Dyella mobilis]MBM7127979.1 helix-turn-helix transcriptional regulator [Dyella mobilis]GLR00128.1 transcriptional regulator [Dyella mobilis]